MPNAFAHSPRWQAGHLQTKPLKDRPDPTRIAAYSGAIAVNAVALLLLLMPISAPPPITSPDVDRPMSWILPEKKPEIVPVVPVQKTPPRKTHAATRVQPRERTPTTEVPVVVDQGSDAVAPVSDEVGEADAAGPVASAPRPGVHLEYASAPPPPYPRDALRMRLTGTVVLQVLVGTDGRPLDVQVQASSGHRQLDEAARRQVLKRWMFRPAMQDGRAVQAIGLVPVAFSVQ
jgi:protein TonB